MKVTHVRAKSERTLGLGIRTGANLTWQERLAAEQGRAAVEAQLKVLADQESKSKESSYCVIL